MDVRRNGLLRINPETLLWGWNFFEFLHVMILSLDLNINYGSSARSIITLLQGTTTEEFKNFSTIGLLATVCPGTFSYNATISATYHLESSKQEGMVPNEIIII